MKFSSPLETATLIKRYKRFLADVTIDSTAAKETVHVPNTGSMKSCLGENWPVGLSLSSNPERKYQKTLEMVHNGECWIGVNTHLTNSLAKELIELRKIPFLKDYRFKAREVTILKSKFDFLLEHNHNARELYLEVKNVTLKIENEEKMAAFPDAVSERGLKHLNDLIELKKQNIDSALLFVVQRSDVNKFRPAYEIHPEYATTLKEAEQSGVTLIAAQFKVSLEEVSFWREIPIHF